MQCLQPGRHSMSQQPPVAFPSAAMPFSGAYGGAYGPSLDAKIQGLEEDLLSTVYDAGYEAGYEAGLKGAHPALLSRAGVAAQTPSGAPHPPRQPPATHCLLQPCSHPNISR